MGGSRRSLRSIIGSFRQVSAARKSRLSFCTCRGRPFLFIQEARQIIGYVPPPDRRMSFEVLLHKLRVAKTRLRVLLVGTDPYDKLPVGTEIDKVREALRTACAKASMAD